jgi:hypothetical protein
MRYRLLPILFLGLCCMGMGQKKLDLSVRFYTQAARTDSESFAVPVTLLNGQQTYVDVIAAISEHDIVAIYPFAVADGSGGCTFKLDDHGTIALDTLSVTKRGTLLIGTINGRQVSDVLIDQRVSDGILTIPNGITTDEMKQLLKRYPVLGGGGKKKMKKKDVYSVGM